MAIVEPLQATCCRGLVTYIWEASTRSDPLGTAGRVAGQHVYRGLFLSTAVTVSQPAPMDKSLPEQSLGSLRKLVYRVADGVCILVGLNLAYGLGQHMNPSQVIAAVSSAILLYSVVSHLTGNYRNWRGTRFDGELVCVWYTWVASLGALVVLGATDAIRQWPDPLDVWAVDAVYRLDAGHGPFQYSHDASGAASARHWDTRICHRGRDATRHPTFAEHRRLALPGFALDWILR